MSGTPGDSEFEPKEYDSPRSSLSDKNLKPIFISNEPNQLIKQDPDWLKFPKNIIYENIHKEPKNKYHDEGFVNESEWDPEDSHIEHHTLWENPVFYRKPLVDLTAGDLSARLRELNGGAMARFGTNPILFPRLSSDLERDYGAELLSNTLRYYGPGIIVTKAELEIVNTDVEPTPIHDTVRQEFYGSTESAE